MWLWYDWQAAAVADEDGNLDHIALLKKFKNLVSVHRKAATELPDEIQVRVKA